MALSHLVDTSVLTRLRLRPIREQIEARANAGELARASVSDLEVGYSARGAAEWDRLMEALEIFELIEITAEHFRRAKQVQRMLAAKHQRGRKIPDLLIAASAEAHGLIVLHYDADFDRISTVTGQRCEWVVAAGSVD
jgi:predicted nucleic acid-binding protein